MRPDSSVNSRCKCDKVGVKCANYNSCVRLVCKVEPDKMLTIKCQDYPLMFNRKCEDIFVAET